MEQAQKLLKSIRSKKSKQSQEYFPQFAFPPLKWYQEEGLYESNIHLNFHGDRSIASIRHLFSIPDSNGFTTMFILQSLIEANNLNKDLLISDEEIQSSIKALANMKAQNLGNPQRSDVPVMSFWKNVKKGDFYSAEPQNLEIPLDHLQTADDFVSNFLIAIGFGNLVEKIKPVLKFPSLFLEAFHIPPDADDTGVNLALGASLGSFCDTKNKCQSEDIWNNIFTENMGELYTVIKKYAYRPFSSNSVENTIDPRTYFWVRNFIEEQIQKGNKNVAIVTTWLMNVNDEGAGNTKMPFHVNNVDGSVAANLLFGITKSILRNPDVHNQHIDKDIEQIFTDTVNVLEFILRKNLLADRKDLILLYYPPIYDFYWFVARLSKELNNQKMPFEFMTKAGQILNNALEQYATQQLLDYADIDGEHAHWEDFLGNADSFLTKADPQHEDRVFSTSVAINALIDIWTVKEEDKLSYKKSSPVKTVEVVEKAVKWLAEESDNYKKENTFFSGSVKGFNSTLPFWYPSNVKKHMNGSEFTCDNYVPSILSTDVLVGVSGIIEPEEYEEMIKKPCFNHEVSVKGEGFNCLACVFPYWSSTALTEAFELLALTKFDSIQ